MTIFVPIGDGVGAGDGGWAARQVELADGRGGGDLAHGGAAATAPTAPGDRFVYRGRNLEVLSAEDINGRRQFLGCRCTERAVTG